MEDAPAGQPYIDLTMQCARPCHDTRYPSLKLAEKLAVAEQDGRIPTELVPRCPKCGGPMDIHMGAGQRMISDTAAQARSTTSAAAELFLLLWYRAFALFYTLYGTLTHFTERLQGTAKNVQFFTQTIRQHGRYRLNSAVQ